MYAYILEDSGGSAFAGGGDQTYKFQEYTILTQAPMVLTIVVIIVVILFVRIMNGL